MSMKKVDQHLHSMATNGPAIEWGKQTYGYWVHGNPLVGISVRAKVIVEYIGVNGNVSHAGSYPSMCLHLCNTLPASANDIMEILHNQVLGGDVL